MLKDPPKLSPEEERDAKFLKEEKEKKIESLRKELDRIDDYAEAVKTVPSPPAPEPEPGKKKKKIFKYLQLSPLAIDM